MSAMEINQLFGLAAGFVNSTAKNIFLTGKAGTGKTTFLKYIKEANFKKMAVVAPTGVAAINAGGVTIHSFFQLPFGSFLPTRQHLPEELAGNVVNEHLLLKNLRFNNAKKELLRELELLVIDEVSMVRADMLDAIDVILRHFRKMPQLPFGGVQLLFIGDLFQLPPVVNHREWQLLKEYYRSPFFFDALALQAAPPVYIELKKIYRQSDAAFISILNNIRNNQCTRQDLEALHVHYHPEFVAGETENYITLTSHNAKADSINETELARLPGKIFSFTGVVEGDFHEKSFPVEKVIQLKVGAQIMFIKNDKGEDRRFYNGKIATVDRIEDGEIVVKFPGEEGELELQKETWRNIRYTLNKGKDEIEEEELGSYTQYPVRLAWAITIHKSQGLTFQKAIIDAGASFAPGQVYVALSRLTSMDGLVLFSKISNSSIHTDERVLGFAQQEMDEATLKELLKEEQKKYIGHTLIKTFRWHSLAEEVQQHLEEYEHRKINQLNAAIEWAGKLVDRVQEQAGVAEKFGYQLARLLSTAVEDNYQQLQERTEAAANYFIKEADALFDSIYQHAAEWKTKGKTKKYIGELEALQQSITRKKMQMQQAAHITTGLAKGMDTTALVQIVEEQRKTRTAAILENQPPKAAKGQTKNLSFEMFRQGKTIGQIANERRLTESTITGHLSEFIATGEIDIKELVAEEKIQPILKAIATADTQALTDIKSHLDNDYSFAEVRAVLNYFQSVVQQAQTN